MGIPNLGPLEIGLIVLLVLIIFGGGKLPQVFGAVGKGIREFRKAKEGEAEESRTGKRTEKSSNNNSQAS